MSVVPCVSILPQSRDVVFIKFADIGGHGHREYDLDLRRIFPFMRLPSLRSLYTLTTFMFWEQSDVTPVDFKPLKHTSNITTLCYDESVLSAVDIIGSLGMFKGLKSFRWTASPTGFGYSPEIMMYQKSFGKALSEHKDTLEELYLEKHFDLKGRDVQIFRTDAIMIGSLKGYLRLKTLAIDATSLCGHQSWSSSAPLVDILPPNLEELTLFVKVIRTDHDDPTTTAFDNILWYPNLLDKIRKAPAKLRKLNIQSTRGIHPRWRPNPEDLEIFWDPSLVQEVEMACAEARIDFHHQTALEVHVDGKRSDGYTTIPFFLDQIKGRNPGRDL